MHWDDRWHKRFISLAEHISHWSKDPSTKCGAVIVRPDKTIASVGFNGFPAPIHDKEEHLWDREAKYSRVIHAEMNALMFMGESARGKGYAMYVWPMCPCDRCMAHIIQAGILDVAFPASINDRWEDAMKRAMEMLGDAGGRLMVLT